MPIVGFYPRTRECPLSEKYDTLVFCWGGGFYLYHFFHLCFVSLDVEVRFQQSLINVTESVGSVQACIVISGEYEKNISLTVDAIDSPGTVNQTPS